MIDRLGARAALLALFLAAAARAQAAFDAVPAGAQAAAMGGAVLAGRGDSAALFHNAAGVAGLATAEAYFLYNRLYAGLSGVDALSQSFAAFGAPTRLGTLAIGLGQYQASGLLQERVVGVAFARRWFDAFDAGVTAKYLHHRYQTGSDPAASADPVFRDGASRGALALDLGAAGVVAGPLSAGIAVRNLNRPDVGLASPDPVPRELQAGLAFDIRSWGLRLTADYLHREGARGTPSLGLEKTLEGGRVKLRAGASPDQFSAGGGLQLDRLGIDYAFTLSRRLMSDNAGTHKLGVRYRFGGSPR